MDKLDRSKLLPNGGNVWQRCVDTEYVELLIASTLMHGAPYGAKWCASTQGNRRTLSCPLFRYDGDDIAREDILMEENIFPKSGGVTHEWWIQIVNYDRMVDFINKG